MFPVSNFTLARSNHDEDKFLLTNASHPINVDSVELEYYHPAGTQYWVSAMINGISHHRDKHYIMSLLKEEYITTYYFVLQSNKQKVKLSLIQVPQTSKEHIKDHTRM